MVCSIFSASFFVSIPAKAVRGFFGDILLITSLKLSFSFFSAFNFSYASIDSVIVFVLINTCMYALIYKFC